MRRVVVTGMGVVSPLGVGTETVWARLLAGRSGITRLPADLAPDVPAQIAGRVPSIAEDAEAGFDIDAAVPGKDQKKMDRFIAFAIAARTRRSPSPAGRRRTRPPARGPRP